MPMSHSYSGACVEQTGYTFETVLNKNKDAIFNLFFRLTGDFHVSEDLFQETFLKVHTGLRNFKGNAKPSTWVYTIALNVFRDYVRKKKWNPFIQEITDCENLDSRADSQTPEEQYIQREEKAGIQKHVCALKPALRVPVILHYIEGFSIPRICELTGRSASDIKVSLHRARRILKKRMGSEQ